MSVENLLFWLECEEYREIKAPEYRGFSARKIYRKYVADNAPTMLGIEDRLRKAIVLGDTPPSALFREAQQAVVVSMKLDIFPRFIESKLYQDLVGLKFEDRKVRGIGSQPLSHRLAASSAYGHSYRPELAHRLPRCSQGAASHDHDLDRLGPPPLPILTLAIPTLAILTLAILTRWPT